ncbi:nucleotidyl transferase AbiEii/AbiGii toxin family protein [Microbacterium testaceum]|uniref:nucleotidyl transferase AbiEii/AbiGii toxin family protein n=1 Tax=Microbacterium testaceum TaxID=2033 RepID=UPI002AC50B6F|nr:nucleotidyl transferase AbiEii/AbiGii toxin family protein [Microbacterium testaceum]MDZ5146309.1 nucleotidyl transferase AbiEii/AbiGii toxin family protein [Microbacterium testaceum]
MAEEDGYRSWKGIAQAIKSEADRAAKAGESTLSVQEQITQANHDRFLSRVFADGEDSEWLLKGGTAMLARVPRARATKDLDLAARTAADLDSAQEALQRAAARDLGDYIRFQLTSARTTGLGQNQPGVDTRRLVFTAQDAGSGRRLFDVPIDVVVGPPPVGTVETTQPSNRLQLGRPIQTHPYRLFPIADQIAEKVTATMDTYAGRPSSRVKDLVDLVTIARTQSVNLRELQMAIDAKRTLAQTAAFTEFAVPDEWQRSYRPLAMKTLPPPYTDIHEAVALAKQLVDPALADEPVRSGYSWIPSRGWTNNPAAVSEFAPNPAQPGGEVHVTGHVRGGYPVTEHWRGARGTGGS